MIFQNNKIKIIISLLFVSILFSSCGKNVPDVPIYIDMNGFQSQEYSSDFENKLKSKLEGFGFCVVADTLALYKIVVLNFYYDEYLFEEEAPYDDCEYSSYNLLAYEYGLKAELIDVNNKNKVLKTWIRSRTKEDDIEEDEVYTNCTSYKIDEPILLGGTFFRQAAIDIAQKSSSIVSDEY